MDTLIQFLFGTLPPEYEFVGYIVTMLVFLFTIDAIKKGFQTK